MPKPGLGKTFGDVMKQANPPASSSNPHKTPEVSPGMASLLRKTHRPAQDASRPPALPRHKTLARISLWSADLLLLAICAYLAWGTTESLTASRLALCIVTLAMGAWLSVLALRL